MSFAGSRRIVSLEWERLDLELTEPFTIASGAQAKAENVIVTVRLEDGTEGLGEAAPFSAVTGETQASVLAALDAAREAVVGLDAAAPRAIAARLVESIGWEAAARCAVEQAVFDALARHAGLPLWALFGGRRAELETDMTIPAGDLQHARRSAQAISARGIRAIKIKVGADTPSADADRIAAVKETAPGARIFVDANGGYDVAGALDLLATLRAREVSIDLFEQPVEAGDLAGLAEVTRRGGVVVCADEAVRSAADVLEIAKRGAAHAINIKLMKCGVVEALAMSSVAEAAGLGRMIGGMVESELSMTFSAHFAHGLGGFDYVDLDTPLFIARSPFSGGMVYEGGRVVLDHIERGAGVRRC